MKNKVLIIISAILGIFVFSSLFVVIRANQPMRQAKKEALQLAKEYVDFKKVTDFYWFTREETYFTLVGQDNKNKDLIVIIPQSGEKITVLDPKEGLSENEALKKVYEADGINQIVKINLGLVKATPTWEVVVENNEDSIDYYLIDFKTGEISEIIRNI